MRKLLKSEQSGRSMVEMLGVLAIIGVLSVAGIAGYSKAMAKYKVTKTVDQVAMIVANIRTIYAGQRNYAGLTTQVAIRIGAVPEDMIVGGANAATEIRNAFQGTVRIIAATTQAGFVNSGFAIRYTGLSRDACATIATSDWGSGSNSGLVGIDVNATSAEADPGIALPTGTTYTATQNLPVTPANAATLCNSNAGVNSMITWYYF